MENQKLLSISDLFKKSFDLYKTRVWTMLLLSLVSGLAMTVMFVLFGFAGFTNFIGAGEVITLNLLSALLILVGILLMLIVSMWVQVAFIYILKEENVNIGVKNLLILAKSSLVSYGWIVFLGAIIIFLGFLFFIIPGIIFSIWFSFFQYVFIFENIKGKKALSRSKELVKGHFWPVLGRFLLLFLITMIISSIFKLGPFINHLFMVPFSVIYFYVIYEDLKTLNSKMPV